MIAFKLFRIRKDGSLGSLFIDRRTFLPEGVWLKAESHPTKGFALRPGWHATAEPHAPHLSMKGRAWFKVEIDDFTAETRPASQGGIWFLAGQMKILEMV